MGPGLCLGAAFQCIMCIVGDMLINQLRVAPGFDRKRRALGAYWAVLVGVYMK